ncbi:MAG: hypothetical protein D6689_07895 [Deltaproteobacteria bacterium]|nr:MAG: hypothetical protein D6689_07895 [Deltaproteobacteria bacterium]
MRVAIAIAAAVASVRPAAADVGSGSAAVGVGMFGGRPATTVDAGIDVAGGAWAVGIGGRVRWLAGEGVRRQDWDEPGDIAAVLRYLTYRREPDGDGIAVAVAAGPLANAVLGHETVVGGLTTGLDVDHRHLGAQVRVAGAVAAGEALVDDVVAPRVIAARGRLGGDRGAAFGATAAGDLELGVAAVALDAEWRAAVAVPYVDLVAVVGRGVGAHAGVAVHADAAGAAWRGVVEAYAASEGYVPGWFGPLYEVDRATPGGLAAAGGFGGRASASVDADGLGRLALAYDRRRGRPDRLAVRLAAPYFARAQLAAWAAADVARGGARAVAAELRVELPAGLFAAGEAARVYRDAGGALEPLWLATIAVGGALAL